MNDYDITALQFPRIFVRLIKDRPGDNTDQNGGRYPISGA